MCDFKLLKVNKNSKKSMACWNTVKTGIMINSAVLAFKYQIVSFSFRFKIIARQICNELVYTSSFAPTCKKKCMATSKAIDRHSCLNGEAFQ